MRSENWLTHVIYWGIVLLVLTVIFGRSWENPLAAFFFISMLLPVVLGTSYFFNYFLIPRFYFTKRYGRFVLYSFYTVVISLYLETIVLMFSFVYLANFSFSNLAPNAGDTILLAVVLFLLVFIGSFIFLAPRIKVQQEQLEHLLKEKEKSAKGFLEVMSNRKLTQIPYDDIIYIESLADYIQIHTEAETIVSKERISKIAERLPDTFLRIHRSFVVNKEKIKSYSYNEVELQSVQLNIGRS
ncbi:MAG: LytTR family transcriptional regulator, partial [Saprospiraceae bacterium]|nr:LytTR family transcriptional regulator [Saprospiraceae bacterium]